MGWARTASTTTVAFVALALAGCAEEAGDADGLIPDDTGRRTTAPEADGGAPSGEASPTDGFYVVEAVDTPPCSAPDLRTDRANETCYRLADERRFGTDAVEVAEPGSAPNGLWQVHLTLTDDGLDAFNGIAATCYQRLPDCPTGQVALVVDDTVVTAPVIHEGSYERDAIVVTGDFTRGEARTLADTLTG